MSRGAWISCLLVIAAIAVLPARAIGAESEQSLSPQVAEAVKKLLEKGFQGSRPSAAQLESEIRAGEQTLGQPNPLFDYACYLVLTKNAQSDAASVRLESAVKSQDPLVLPAREEWIRLRLKEKKYAVVLESLVDLAADVGRIPETDPTTVDAHQTAQWIGTMVTYLKGPLGDDAVKAEAEIVAAPLRDRLGRIYASSFDRGVAETGLIYHDLAAQILTATKLAEEQKHLALQEAAQRADAVQEQKEKITESAETLREVAREGLGDLTSKIEALEKLFETSLQTEQSLLNLQVQLNAEIFSLRRQLESSPLANSSNRITPTGASNQGLLFNEAVNVLRVKELQSASLTNELAMLAQQRRQMMQQGRQLLAQRQLAASTYNNRAGGVQKQFAALDRLQARMESAAKQNAQKDIFRAPEVTALKRRVKEFSTYSSHAVEDQKTRLLESTAMVRNG